MNPAAVSAVPNDLFRTASPRSDAVLAAVSETADGPAPRTAPTALDDADDQTDDQHEDRRPDGHQTAGTVGLEVPVEAWRHDTAYFGLPPGRTADFPIVIDEVNQVYFRPEGHDMMLVGLEAGNEVGGSPDRPLISPRPASVEDMVKRVCARIPWMAEGTFRTAHGGQDGITTADQRPILGRAGPDGFVLACGFSGTGFKTAPTVGLCLAELILDGRATTVDIAPYGLDRFAQGRLLVGEHPYGKLWR